MLTFAVEIEGLEPGLLQHRCPIEFAGTGPAIKYSKPEEEAEAAAYRMEEGNLYQPAEHLERALIGAAGMFKIGRRSAAGVAAPAFLISPRQLDHGTDHYEIDIRPVVIPSTKGRVARARPLIFPWKLQFDLILDDSLINSDLARQILDTAGRQKGIGDFRPEKKGPFGRFIVTKWKKK